MSLSDEIDGVIVGGVEVKMPRYSQIDGRLWVGGLPRVQAPSGFDFIINLNPAMNYMLHKNQVQLCHPMYDVREIPALAICAHLVESAKRFLNFGPTLIHCREGLNRAPFIAALVLINLGRTPADAVRLMKEKRSPHVFTNDTYEKCLLELKREEVKWQ